MSLIAPYFISILLSFPLVQPSDGWLQWVYKFPNKATCEEFLEQQHESLYLNVTRAFITMPHEIVEFRCMTIEEGVEANKALGHREPNIPRPNTPNSPKI